MPWAINPRSLVLKEMSSEGHYYCSYISYCNRKKLAWAFQNPIFPLLVSFQRSGSQDSSQLFCMYIDFQGNRVCPLSLKQRPVNWSVCEDDHLALHGQRCSPSQRTGTGCVLTGNPWRLDDEWVKTQPIPGVDFFSSTAWTLGMWLGGKWGSCCYMLGQWCLCPDISGLDWVSKILVMDRNHPSHENQPWF